MTVTKRSGLGRSLAVAAIAHAIALGLFALVALGAELIDLESRSTYYKALFVALPVQVLVGFLLTVLELRRPRLLFLHALLPAASGLLGLVAAWSVSAKTFAALALVGRADKPRMWAAGFVEAERAQELGLLLCAAGLVPLVGVGIAVLLRDRARAKAPVLLVGDEEPRGLSAPLLFALGLVGAVWFLGRALVGWAESQTLTVLAYAPTEFAAPLLARAQERADLVQVAFLAAIVLAIVLSGVLIARAGRQAGPGAARAIVGFAIAVLCLGGVVIAERKLDAWQGELDAMLER